MQSASSLDPTLPSTLARHLTSDHYSCSCSSSTSSSIASNMLSSPHAPFVKMEDITPDSNGNAHSDFAKQSSLAPSLLDMAPSLPATPAACADTARSGPGEGRQGKKRKSWGQVLPEPTTNLPPRKRAKTTEEKEQRRIERVKRNRLAAHNSRERKREEVEKLEHEKDLLAARLKWAEDELQAYRRAFPQGPDGTGTGTAVHLFDASPQAQHPPFHHPRQASSIMTSPASLMDSLDSPSSDSHTAPSTPQAHEDVLLAAGPDQTRHSAAMPCDLQCRSGPALPLPSPATASLMAATTILAASSLYWTWTALLTTLISATLSTWIQRCRSSRFSRAWSTPLPLTSTTPLLSPTRLRLLLPSLTRSIPSSPTCSPTPAQQLMFATSLALQRITTINASPSSSSGVAAGASTTRGDRYGERFKRLALHTAPSDPPLKVAAGPAAEEDAKKQDAGVGDAKADAPGPHQRFVPPPPPPSARKSVEQNRFSGV